MRVVGDLLRFEDCPLRYRVHGIGRWAEVDAADAPRLSGTLVHGALNNAGTACRPVSAGGEGLPANESVATRAIAVARRLVDAISPREKRSATLQYALDGAEAIARRTILDLGPHVFPFLTATEQRHAATRRHIVDHHGEVGRHKRLRNVERFEVSGVLDAFVGDIVPKPDGTWLQALIFGAMTHPTDAPTTAMIDYKLARRPTAVAGAASGELAPERSLGAHEFQVAAYASIRDRFVPGRACVGIVIYLSDLFPEGNLHGDAALKSRPEEADGASTTASGASSTGRHVIGARLQHATSVVELDAKAIAQATARIDRIGAEIETCAEREAASVPWRRAWPARRSALCGTCDVRPICPQWQDDRAASPAMPLARRGYSDGEPEDA
jgi:hypothetical protein